MKTFVVRLWTSTEAVAGFDEELRGLVEQVGSGGSSPFGNADELVALLRHAAVAGQPAGMPDQPRPPGGQR